MRTCLSYNAISGYHQYTCLGSRPLSKIRMISDVPCCPNDSQVSGNGKVGRHVQAFALSSEYPDGLGLVEWMRDGDLDARIPFESDE